MAEDETVTCFEFESASVGTGMRNFNADQAGDGIVFTGSEATFYTPVFTDGDIVLSRKGAEETFVFLNALHVHQPLIQSVVDHLLGGGSASPTGDSGARAS